MVDDDNLPKFFDEKLVYSAYDKLLVECDRITGLNQFENDKNELLEDVIDRNRLNGIEAAFNLMKYNDPVSLETLKYFDIHVPDCSTSNIMRVNRMIKRERTRIKIQGKITRSLQTGLNSQKITFAHAVQQYSNIVKREINYFTITLNQWFYLQKEVDKIAASKKHGKTTKF